VRFNAVATCLPDVPHILVSVDADSLPLPIEFITLAHGAISFGSDVDMQWNHTQRAFVGIGLVLFQLTSRRGQYVMWSQEADNSTNAARN
jgi:hypothetical protein